MIFCFSLDFSCFVVVVFQGKLWYELQFLMFYSMVGKYRTTVFNMLATSKSFGNIYFFDQQYQPRKITLEVSVLVIEYLVFVSFESLAICAIILGILLY